MFSSVEEPPTFPGGEAELMHWIANNLRYPVEAFTDSLQGRVVVMFVVGADGAVSSPKVVKSVAPSLDKEAVRVISELPKFNPGKVAGKPVSVYYTIPITFRLTSK